MHITTACGLFGHCRQAYYQLKTDYLDRLSREKQLIASAKEIRSEAPGVGSVKLHMQLKDIYGQEFMIGRDAFIELLRKHSLVLPAPRPRRTTNSNHSFRKYKNLIKDLTITKANELWVSDITYIDTMEGFSYLHLVTDAYSRRIMGWRLANSLKAIHSIEALKMAIDYTKEDSLEGLIHHSDRGKQYCSTDYVKELNNYKISISMTQDSKPTDNAIAERVNGIIKQELIYRQKQFKDIKELEIKLFKFIEYYNKRRPHMSLKMQTPDIAHLQEGNQKKLWKLKVYKKYRPHPVQN